MVRCAEGKESEMTELPRVLYLQVFGDGDKSEGLPLTNEDITWSTERVFDSDVRYLIDKRYTPKKKRSPAPE